MKKYFYCVIVFWVFTAYSNAQLNPLPISAQAIVFKKIFPYIKTFQRTDNVKLLIVYNENAEKEKDELVKAFTNEKINVKACHPDQVLSFIKEYNVIYVTQSVAGSNIRNLCRKNKKLSIAGNPEIVSKGDASISIVNAAKNEPGKKIKITSRVILNLTQLQNEAQEVTELLNIDSIIKVW